MSPVQEMTEVEQVIHRGYRLTCYNPFGFWSITQEENGPAPQKLSGQYTTLPDATNAIDAYLKRLEQEALKKSHVDVQIKKNEEKAKKALQKKTEDELKEKILSGQEPLTEK